MRTMVIKQRNATAVGTRRLFCSALVVLCVLGASSAHAQVARTRPRATPTPVPAVEVARIGFVEGGAEVQRPGGDWTAAVEDQPLSIGDHVRTLPGGTLRIEFPWTAIAMGDSSEVSLPKAGVLTLQLESGRIDLDPEQTLLRVLTPEATVSGSGRTLVRREGTTTFVASYSGGAVVEARDVAVRLGINKGTAVRAGQPPDAALPLGPAPRVVSPASDPRYVLPGEVVRLTWTGDDPTFHLEVLSIDSDVPVISLDIEGQGHDLRLNWLGTFRWRVSGRRGAVESQTSGEGLICVVEK
ncbi:MAG: hypothetical protein KA385_00135 [Vicinamibacteria bacterium]|nr:hypothetical protein [Vicinamibacteria bacterium]